MGQDYNEILLEATEVVAKTVAADLVSSLEAELKSEPVELEPFVIDPTARILPIEIFTTQESSILITDGETSKSYTWLLDKAASYDRLTLSMKITVNTPTSAAQAAAAEEETEDEYGIKIIIWGSEKTITLQLTSKDMLGNAKIFYNTLQKYSFDISEVVNIYKIDIGFYKKNYASSSIIFNNVQAQIGYDTHVYGTQMGESLILQGATEDLQYHSRVDGLVYDGNSHALSLTWVYQDEEGVYQVINKNNSDRRPADTTVFWYHYQQGVRGDGYGGENWVKIENATNSFNYTVNNFNGNLEQEQYKVVLLRHNIVDNTMVATESNIITIQNIKDEKTVIFKNPSLQFKDGSNGIYSFYDFDDIVHSNYFSETTRMREIGIVYTSDFTWDAISLQIDKIVWRVPLDNVTVSTEIEDKFSSADELYNYYEVYKYQDTTETDESQEANLEEPILFYTIAAQRQQTAANVITCIITMKNGDEYFFEKGINFTTINLTRFNYNVIAHLQDARGNVRSAIKVGETLTLQVQVYDANGVSITTSSGVFLEKEKKNIDYTITKNQIQLISITTGQLPYLVLKYTYTINSPIDVNTSSIDEEGNTITETRSITLEQLIPIPISTYSDNILYQGPDTVIYSSAGGSPVYNMQEIKILDLNNNKISTNVELQRCDNTASQFQVISSKAKGEIYPKIASNNRLICPQVFDQAIKEELLLLILKVEATTDAGTKTGYYYQPIIMTQDVYFSSIINNWDGSLTIDEEGNYILASAYVAGSKNDVNQFTGVIMGDLNTINPNATGENDKNIQMSGLFGYHEGIQSFGFKTDGTAFLGKSGAGQIKFDGNGGLIQSGNFYRYGYSKDITGMPGGEYWCVIGAYDVMKFLFLPNKIIDATAGKLKLTYGTWEQYYDYEIKKNNDDNWQYTIKQSPIKIESYDSSLKSFRINLNGFWVNFNTYDSIYQLREDSPSLGADDMGMLINLETGEIYTKNFSLDNEGNVIVKGTIEAEAGKLANFFISKAHLGNKEKLVDSTFGLANPTIANKTDEVNAIYGRLNFDTDKAPSGISRITIFAGAKPSSNENEDTNAEINTKGLPEDEEQNGIPYYVTTDGFLKANNIYSRGSIVNESDNYRIALSAGQIIIKGLTSGINTDKILYKNTGIDLNDENLIEFIDETNSVKISNNLFIDGDIGSSVIMAKDKSIKLQDQTSYVTLSCSSEKSSTLGVGYLKINGGIDCGSIDCTTLYSTTISGGAISGTTINSIKIGNITYAISINESGYLKGTPV